MDVFGDRRRILEPCPAHTWAWGDLYPLAVDVTPRPIAATRLRAGTQCDKLAVWLCAVAQDSAQPLPLGITFQVLAWCGDTPEPVGTGIIVVPTWGTVGLVGVAWMPPSEGWEFWASVVPGAGVQSVTATFRFLTAQCCHSRDKLWVRGSVVP